MCSRLWRRVKVNVSKNQQKGQHNNKQRDTGVTLYCASTQQIRETGVFVFLEHTYSVGQKIKCTTNQTREVGGNLIQTMKPCNIRTAELDTVLRAAPAPEQQ